MKIRTAFERLFTFLFLKTVFSHELHTRSITSSDKRYYFQNKEDQFHGLQHSFLKILDFSEYSHFSTLNQLPQTSHNTDKYITFCCPVIVPL